MARSSQTIYPNDTQFTPNYKPRVNATRLLKGLRLRSRETVSTTGSWRLAPLLSARPRPGPPNLEFASGDRDKSLWRGRESLEAIDTEEYRRWRQDALSPRSSLCDLTSRVRYDRSPGSGRGERLSLEGEGDRR